MILVVGAGFSGATIANLLADKSNEKVLIIDKNSHIGGSCYDYRDKNGIMIQSYGSHIFHTNSDCLTVLKLIFRSILIPCMMFFQNHTQNF